PAEGDRLCVNTVGAPDTDGVPVLVGPGDHGGERALDALANQPARVLNPEGKSGVDDVRRGQPVVEPASLRPQLLGHSVHEGRRVVIRDPLDLGDAGARRRNGSRADFGDVARGNHVDFGPPVERSELDLEPPRELARLRPDPGHGRTGVASDHWLDSREAVGPRIRAARTAAFFALSTPTHATGTPGGICAIERRASRPSRTLSDERSGTPITGSSVCAASTPGRAAASPAPAMSTRSPRSRAVRPYSATASGCRWAERTSNSCSMPRASSSSSAACMRSRSDSEPTTIPTNGLDMS